MYSTPLSRNSRLPVDDTFDDAVDRLPAVLDVAKQVDGRADLFLDEILCFFRRLGLVEQADDMSG